MTYPHRSRQRHSVTAGFVVLALVAISGVGLVTLALPRVQHLRNALRSTLVGNAINAGPPVVCRGGDVLASTHKGDDLALRERCVTAVGRVVLILHAPDGDTHINLLPDRGYWRLLNRRNLLLQGGTLVVEVVPADRRIVAIPALGTHIRVTGAYVTDLRHGWREVHPAWQIVRLSE